ncbi:MAG TPA: GNAT family N-acetyltransferase [Pirellulales bacterium]|jgi:phosphinothricin acetyltransferase|nr:GNAT family N-acetyltransferase [Pirellulales bacterium]
MKIIQCDESHAEPILAIFNDAIANTTSLYDYHARTLQTMHSWFADKRKGNYPVIGVVNEAGQLMGFGTYGTFRVRPAYKYTVEHSVYVDAQFRGQGVGKVLMREVIAAAEAQNYHVLVGGIDSQNAVSIALHKQFGFAYCGTVKQAGFKFGRWLDLDFYQLILKTPAEPVDG